MFYHTIISLLLLYFCSGAYSDGSNLQLQNVRITSLDLTPTEITSFDYFYDKINVSSVPTTLTYVNANITQLDIDINKQLSGPSEKNPHEVKIEIKFHGEKIKPVSTTKAPITTKSPPTGTVSIGTGPTTQETSSPTTKKPTTAPTVPEYTLSITFSVNDTSQQNFKVGTSPNQQTIIGSTNYTAEVSITYMLFAKQEVYTTVNKHSQAVVVAVLEGLLLAVILFGFCYKFCYLNRRNSSSSTGFGNSPPDFYDNGRNRFEGSSTVQNPGYSYDQPITRTNIELANRPSPSLNDSIQPRVETSQPALVPVPLNSTSHRADPLDAWDDTLPRRNFT